LRAVFRPTGPTRENPEPGLFLCNRETALSVARGASTAWHRGAEPPGAGCVAGEQPSCLPVSEAGAQPSSGTQRREETRKQTGRDGWKGRRGNGALRGAWSVQARHGIGERSRPALDAWPVEEPCLDRLFFFRFTRSRSLTTLSLTEPARTAWRFLCPLHMHKQGRNFGRSGREWANTTPARGIGPPFSDGC
jgi:hypothetical protein